MANTEQELMAQFEREYLANSTTLHRSVVFAKDETGRYAVPGARDAFDGWKLGRAKAAQSEAVALPAYYARADQLAQVDRIGPGFCSLSAKPRAGLTEPLYTAPPASAHTDLHTEIEKLVARNDALLANENRLLDELLRIQDELLRAQASVGAADGFKARLLAHLKYLSEEKPALDQLERWLAESLIDEIERGDFDSEGKGNV